MPQIARPTRIAVGIAVSVAVVAAPTGVGFAAYRRDRAGHGVLPRGSVVETVDVSGLDEATAVARVREALADRLDRPVTVSVGGHRFFTSMRELGVADRTEAAVAEAIALARDGSWFGRAWQRMFGDVAAGPDASVSIGEPDPAAVERFLNRVAKTVEIPVRDPGVTVVDGFLRFTKGVTGARLDRAHARAKLRDLSSDTAHELRLTPVAPAVAPQKYATAILVRTGENKLYVYQNGVITRTYGVATGSRRYPTPTGTFEVTLKRYRPTWYNPGSPWARNEPAFIPPGPNNPLGTRALNLSADGIRIHGTPASRSIGYSVSHGCIRMHMREVEALYEIIPVGTPVVIVRAAAAKTAKAPVETGSSGVADGG